MTAPTSERIRHLGRRKPTEAELAVLSHYRAEWRTELLRRWRAGEFYVRNDRLVEVNPRVKEHALRVTAAAAEREAKKKRRRHAAARSAATNRKRSKR